MCVSCLHFADFSRLLSDTPTLMRKHILRANPMFAFGQTVVVGFSQISGSLSSRKRTWHHLFIPHASFHHGGEFCCKSLKSLLLAPTSEPGHLFTFDQKTLSMYRCEFHANKSIFACWCWLCSSNRQVAVCTFPAKLTLSVWCLEMIHCVSFDTSLVPVLFVTLIANITFSIPRRYSFICAQ